MSEKYDGLKKLFVICTAILVLVGLFANGTGTYNVRTMPLYASVGEVFETSSELEVSVVTNTGFETTEEAETEEWGEAETESEESVVEDPVVEEPVIEEPIEEEPELPAYTVTDMTAFMYAQTDCNVRSGPSTDYEVIGYIALNQGVNIIGRADTGWYKIDYSGMDAFVSDSLLAETQVVIEQPAPQPQPQPEPQPTPQPETVKQRWEYTEEELIQIALAEAGVHDGMTAWEKADAINDYLCNFLTYDYTYSHYSTFDTLAYGTAICQGYANAFKKMMEAAGVPTDYVRGQGWTGVEWGRHGWNRVLIDGTYYYVDVTWNDSLGTDDYFMISYEQMSLDHYQESINPYRVE